MIIINGYYKQKEILELVEKSTPEENTTFSVLNITEKAGWVDIVLKNNEKEFSIKYSSVMTDSADLFLFLIHLINLKEDIALVLDNEGSDPLIYGKPIDNKIRFLFAHDYELYHSFLKGEINDYELNNYKIECDILIEPTIILKEFYKILSPYVENYEYNASDEYGCEFNVNKAKKILNMIKPYISEN